MTILIILIVLAMIFFGIGAVIEGLFWMLLIGFALVVAAIWFGLSRMDEAPTDDMTTMTTSGRRTQPARQW